MSACERRALVLGATGFLGRHLILALLDARVRVVAGCRSRRSGDELVSWVRRHAGDVELELALVDFAAPALGIGREQWTGITEIYNCAGAYRFGMSQRQARAGNVETARAVVAAAATVNGLRRVVHVSGYRVGGQDPTAVPWPAARVRETYRRLGAYEASKVEADAVFQAEAIRLGIPWTIVNPSAVSGVAATGESEQYLGLAGSSRDLWHGRLTALPGNGSTFVPVVPVDYLARFMAVLPTDEETVNASYWVLDDATPPLPELLRLVGEHYQVTVPRLRVPVGLVRRLPAALTKADPETLTFLSADRYPTAAAQQVAARHGLVMPPAVPSILRWADYLAAHRFGAATATGLTRGYVDIAGVRTFRAGPADATAVVLPGLPINADTWIETVSRWGAAAVADLPGLGLSRGDLADWDRWADALATSYAHLVGHSIGAAVAVEVADRQPDAVKRLTLVAPFFLQAPPDLGARLPWLTAAYLSRASPAALARRLTGSTATAPALASSASDLRRGRTARRVGRLLRRVADRHWRRELVAKLARFRGEVHVVVGSRDPLDPAAAAALAPLGSRLRIEVIDGAGHYPQLTHPPSWPRCWPAPATWWPRRAQTPRVRDSRLVVRPAPRFSACPTTGETHATVATAAGHRTGLSIRYCLGMRRTAEQRKLCISELIN